MGLFEIQVQRVRLDATRATGLLSTAKLGRLLLASALMIQFAAGETRAETANTIRAVAREDLPKEALATLVLIKTGGPFPYQRDGAVFGNFERRLPIKERGYYKEYTVPTPGSRTRGARRIIAGAGREYFYTDDHYKTFRRIRE